MTEKISQIKERYKVCPVEQLPEFVASIQMDERAGVQKIAETAKRPIRNTRGNWNAWNR